MEIVWSSAIFLCNKMSVSLLFARARIKWKHQDDFCARGMSGDRGGTPRISHDDEIVTGLCSVQTIVTRRSKHSDLGMPLTGI
jgi:hypothetical protein